MPDGGFSEIKTLLDKQGEAFEAFKASHAEQMKKADAVATEKLSRIEAALDQAVEAKAAIEARLDAEKQEREELEARLGRARLDGGKDAGQDEVELKTFNGALQGLALQRNKTFQPLDAGQKESYRAVQEKLLREGKENLTADEVKTMSVGSDPDGGYYVTPDISGRIVTKIYETSPMRQIANVQTISTDKLEGIEDLGEGGAGYAGETTTSGDATTAQIGNWSIPVYWIDTEPKATQQLLDDASVNIEAWIANKAGAKLGRFENAEFVAGASGRIRGLTSYTTAADSGSGVTWGQVGYVASGAAGALASSNPLDKIHSLMGALKQDYLPNARFLTNRAMVTTLRKVKDGTGNYIWQPSFVMGVAETIMGHPVTRAEDMPAIAADAYSLAFGDFLQAYQIVDRQGIRILRDALTAKPYVKFYTTKRTGGGVVNFEAFKLLKLAAS